MKICKSLMLQHLPIIGIFVLHLLIGCGVQKQVVDLPIEVEEKEPTIEQLYAAYNDSLYNRVEPIINLLIDNPSQTDSFLNQLVFTPLRPQKLELSRKTAEDWDRHFEEEAKRGVFDKKPHNINVPEPEGEIKKAFAKSLELVIPIGLYRAKQFVIDSVGADPSLAPRKDELFDSVYVAVLDRKERASIMAFVEIEKRAALNQSTPDAFDKVVYAGLTAEERKQLNAPSSPTSTSRQRTTPSSSKKSVYYTRKAKQAYQDNDLRTAIQHANAAIDNGEDCKEPYSILSMSYQKAYDVLRKERKLTAKQKDDMQRYKELYEKYKRLSSECSQ